jgi:hypothetical protein
MKMEVMLQAANRIAPFFRNQPHELTSPEGRVAGFSAYLEHARKVGNPEGLRMIERYNRHEESEASDRGEQEYFGSIQWMGLWGALGCPRIRVEGKWAALLCESSIPKELYDLVIPPWPAMVVSLPEDLGLVVPLGGRDCPLTQLRIMRVQALRRETMEPWWCWNITVQDRPDHKGNAHSKTLTLRLDDLCGDHRGDNCSSAVDRSTDLIGPIVGGICMAFASGMGKRVAATKKIDRHSRRHPIPQCDEWVLGKPVMVDLRPRIRAFIKSGLKVAGPLHVQVLVRGHWKQQPHGVGRTERKFIHIEPYWRGPEDAPIAVRPHVLTKSDAIEPPA